MDTIANILKEATPFLGAITAMLVVIHGFQLRRVEKQTNGMSRTIQMLAQEKGRQEEHSAASKGETTVGTPLK